MAVCNKAPELASNVAKVIQRGYFESPFICILNFIIVLRVEVALLTSLYSRTGYVHCIVCV